VLNNVLPRSTPPPAAPTPPTTPISSGTFDPRTEHDPNEKISPPGYGSQHIILPGNDLQYTIYFENVMTATAPAQQVVVVDQLDTNLDWSTLIPSEIAFGNQVLALSGQAGGYYAQATIPDYRPDVNQSWWVDVRLEVDYQTGELLWTFNTLDPLSGEIPTDPLAGFLPPEDGSGRGQGHVSFTIFPKESLPLGTLVSNQANITFGYNQPILTNQVWNTIDYLKLFLPVVARR
jgi:uncharacterized repeat protein (TIGR01451 family)